jgi:hypothetical protein
MSPVSKIILTLAALGVVHALPQAPYPTGDPTPVPSSTATPPPPPAANNDDLIAQLLTKPTAIKKFKLLLTDGDKLLGQEEIKKQTVFDFNNAQPNPGAEGGATKSAVSPSTPPSLIS